MDRRQVLAGGYMNVFTSIKSQHWALALSQCGRGIILDEISKSRRVNLLDVDPERCIGDFAR